MRVFELAEGELGLGLGLVGGDDPGGRPVAVIGDQHVLAGQFFFESGAGGLIDGPCQAQALGWSPANCQVTTRRTQVTRVILPISASW